MRAYRIAYDGRDYHGFQRQPDVATVEDAIFDAFVAAGVCSEPPPPGYAAAGRTDAGVSALGQVVAVDAPDWCRPAALSAHLPEDVVAWASADAPPDFHATADATHRTYEYYLYAPADESTAARERGGTLDDERARRVLDRLAGTHDLHNLTPDDATRERTVETGLAREGDHLVLTVRGDGFPRHCVRRIAALVESVAAGRATLDYVDRVLGPEPLSGPEGVPTAPASPLVLVDVGYPALTFDVDERAARSARATFDERRATARTAARVTGRIHDGIGAR